MRVVEGARRGDHEQRRLVNLRTALIATGLAGASVAAFLGLRRLHEHDLETKTERAIQAIIERGPDSVISKYGRTSKQMTGLIGDIVDDVGGEWGLTKKQIRIWHAIALKKADLYGELPAKDEGVIWTNWSREEAGRAIGLDLGKINEKTKTRIIGEINRVERDIDQRMLRERAEQDANRERTRAGSHRERMMKRPSTTQRNLPRRQ